MAVKSACAMRPTIDWSESIGVCKRNQTRTKIPTMIAKEQHR